MSEAARTKRSLHRAATLLLAALLGRPAIAKDLPDWLETARATVSPAASATVHAHQLFHGRHVTCPAKGRNVVVDRGAIRLLDHQAADEARVAVFYDRASARVRALQAWLVAPDGHVTVLGDRDAIDVSLADWGSLKTDMRARGLQAEGAKPGAVFAWEWSVEEEALFADQLFSFGASIPIALERFELELPPGVEPSVLTFGNNVPAPTRQGNTWSWERHDVAAQPDEPASASGRSWQDWFVASPHPGPGVEPMSGRTFASWAEASHWLAAISEANTAPAPSVAAVSASVGGTGTPLARARALGRSVQSVNYVSVAVGLARGEGYRPHAAADVLRAGFGDCKDKANLFCALARGAGLESWLVGASTLGRDHVRPQWPSPRQFNHCIAALQVPDGTGLAAVMEGTPFGALLFFDPTDPFTPFGSLPDQLQGSWVLVEHADKGVLLRLPIADERRSRSQWTFRARMDSTGGLSGTWVSELHGSPARDARAAWSNASPRTRERLERMLADWLGGSTIDNLLTTDDPDSDAFRMRLDVHAERVGRPMGSGMLAFRTAPAAAPFDWESSDTTRTTPIALDALSRSDSLVVEIPGGWRVDDPPEPVSLERDFGAFAARWAVSGDTLTFTLVTRLKPVTLAPGRYRELLAFGDAIRRARRTQVVLVHA